MLSQVVSVSLMAIALKSQAQIIQSAVGSPFSLFAGQNFSAWIQQGNANWQIADHQVVMNQGAGWLIGKLTLTNVELEVEYWLDTQAKASLYLRCSNPRYVGPDTAYQINLATQRITGYGAGSIVGFFRARPQNTSSRWNTLKVSARNNYLNIWLNGEKVIDNLHDTHFISGPIALHVTDGEFRIKSFNVTIPGRW